MAIFKLNEANFSFLKNYLYSDLSSEIFEKNKCITCNEVNKEKSVFYEIKLSNHEVSLIIDFLSDLLVEKGLDVSGEPNSLGLRIENIIDIFSNSHD